MLHRAVILFTAFFLTFAAHSSALGRSLRRRSKAGRRRLRLAAMGLRTTEAEADAYGLNAARQPDGAAQGALQLSQYRKMHPTIHPENDRTAAHAARSHGYNFIRM
jgi:hypothetical protein